MPILPLNESGRVGRTASTLSRPRAANWLVASRPPMRSSLKDHTSATERTVSTVGLVVLAVVLALSAVWMDRLHYDAAVGAVVLVAIVVISLPVLRRLASRDDDQRMFMILATALIAKMAFSLVRYFVLAKVYGWVGDAGTYDRDGWALAQAIRSGSPLPAIASVADEVGTGRIVQLTGFIYVVIGRSLYGGFFIYAWMAFWGLVLIIRGCRWGFPEVDQRRLAILVLFFPSLLFWPSSVGKDAVMILLIGLVAYGAGRLLGPSPNLLGLIPFIVGLGGMLLIRPHVGLMAVLALLVSMGFSVLGGGRRVASTGSGRRLFVRVAALVVLVVGAATAASQTAQFFVERSNGSTSTTEALEMTVDRTQMGGSRFDPVIVRTPADIPAATLSVLYRPFLWEASNFGNAIAAGESILLFVLTIMSWKRLRRWPGTAWRRPFVVFASAYVFMFVIAFSNIANAGILARQRTQAIPFFLLLLAIPSDRWWRRNAKAAASAGGEGHGADLLGSPAATSDVAARIDRSVSPVAFGERME